MLRRLKHRAWKSLKYMIEGNEKRLVDEWMTYLLPRLSPLEKKMLFQAHDDRVPLPEGAETALVGENPRLMQLRAAYKSVNLPVSVRSQWNQQLLDAQLDLRYFRGDNPYIWQYREWPRANTLKYYIYAQYVLNRDTKCLFDRLTEDGSFGCWSYTYPGIGTFSREQIDSVNEILFLDRQLGILERQNLRVLDIGAGYGRLAHRLSQVMGPALDDYCCVDAIPESTFLCEYYLNYYNKMPPVRVVPLHEIKYALIPDHYDIAVNIHSFSECTYEAITWWIECLRELRIPNLLILPNDPLELLSKEPDHSKRDFRPLIEAAGYELATCEPVLSDPAVRELLGVHDHYFLFKKAG